MEREKIDKLLNDIYENSFLWFGNKYDAFLHICEITKNIYLYSESVPEFIFNSSLYSLLCEEKVEVIAGIPDLADEELRELEETIPVLEHDLEFFINPPTLFLKGEIRPDSVFRKGPKNYLIFEIDSFLYHANQQQLIRDKVRERKISSLGVPVFRFAAKEVLKNPREIAKEAFKILKQNKFL